MAIDKSRDIGYVTYMAVGKSKRIVIDVDDVELKRRLHSALAQDGLSMKNWFVTVANSFLRNREYTNQLSQTTLQAADPIEKYADTQPKGKL